MLDAMDLSDPDRRDVHGVVGGLAQRCGWAAFDSGAHEPARALFRLALYAAVRAADPDLRAHVLADVAAQHNFLGYHDNCLEIIRFAEGDERVSPAVAMVLHGVRARAYAATGQAVLCRRHVDLAERAASAADPAVPGWVGRMCQAGQVWAQTGHALAVLGARDGEPSTVADAQRRRPGHHPGRCRDG
jgi:hypothetical protein